MSRFRLHIIRAGFVDKKLDLFVCLKRYYNFIFDDQFGGIITNPFVSLSGLAFTMQENQEKGGPAIAATKQRQGQNSACMHGTEEPYQYHHIHDDIDAQKQRQAN
ncbi:hypothetical protein ACJX0J_015009 [Zea mays]